MLERVDYSFIFDGGFPAYFESEYGSHGMRENANITAPEAVFNIHKEYINSGSNCIRTNTSNVNSINFPYDFHSVIESGYEIACSAAKECCVNVFADIGYISPKKFPDLSDDDIAGEYIKKADIFLRLGAKNFIFETFCEFDVMIGAIEFIKKSRPDSLVFVSYAISRDGYTNKGISLEELVLKSDKNNFIDGTSMNCMCGPKHMTQLFRKIINKFKPNKFFGIIPNAGYSSSMDSNAEADNSTYFATEMCKVYKDGANILGGCCGTTPLHIGKMVQEIKSIASQPKTSEKFRLSPVCKTEYFDTFSKWEKECKIIAVEVPSPVSTDMSSVSFCAGELSKCGVDFITVPDGALAKVSADSMAMSAKIKREYAVDTIPHLCCRDRNYMAIKGSLIAASIEDVSNILVITGDPVSISLGRNEKGVFDFNSYELINYIDRLNKEVFYKKPFIIGCGMNVNAVAFGEELARTLKKVENGAKFVFSQPIFNDRGIENFKKARRELNCKILVGILPVVSYKNALFMNNEIAGIDIPDDFINAIRDKSDQEVESLSFDYFTRIISRLFDYCDGYYLMSSVKKMSIICRLIVYIKTIHCQ